jgi:hypothetical protein
MKQWLMNIFMINLFRYCSIAFNDVFMWTLVDKTKGPSNMDILETPGTLGTTHRTKINQTNHTTQTTKTILNTNPSKTQG